MRVVTPKGVFNKITPQNESSFEDAIRVLALPLCDRISVKDDITLTVKDGLGMVQNLIFLTPTSWI